MSRAFFFLERPDGTVGAIGDAQGLSVPLFTDFQAARAAAERQGQGASAAPLGEQSLTRFGEACRRAGAASLRLDPTAQALEAAEWSYLRLAPG